MVTSFTNKSILSDTESLLIHLVICGFFMDAVVKCSQSEKWHQKVFNLAPIIPPTQTITEISGICPLRKCESRARNAFVECNSKL